MASPNQRCTDEEFIALFQKYGAAEAARQLNVAVVNVYQRRSRLEAKYARSIAGPAHANSTRHNFYPQRIARTLKDGYLISGSDAHIWPDEPSPALRGMIHVAKELKPKIISLNGDILDGAGISRHPPIGWEEKPSLPDEIQAVDDFLEKLRRASKNAEHIWTLGNHDARLENHLAAQAPGVKGVKGMRLSDHFPQWTFAWSLWVNSDVVIKHRFKGGIHATHNNALWSGKTLVTGHLHSLKVTPLSDYNGTRFGVDSGTLADPFGPHTNYMEENPRNHRSGFVILKFVDGVLLWPEVAVVVDKNHIQFRGEIISV